MGYLIVCKNLLQTKRPYLDDIYLQVHFAPDFSQPKHSCLCCKMSSQDSWSCRCGGPCLDSWVAAKLERESATGVFAAATTYRAVLLPRKTQRSDSWQEFQNCRESCVSLLTLCLKLYMSFRQVQHILSSLPGKDCIRRRDVLGCTSPTIKRFLKG